MVYKPVKEMFEEIKALAKPLQEYIWNNFETRTIAIVGISRVDFYKSDIEVATPEFIEKMLKD